MSRSPWPLLPSKECSTCQKEPYVCRPAVFHAWLEHFVLKLLHAGRAPCNKYSLFTQALDASTLEALQPAAALGAACEFLAAARGAGAAGTLKPCSKACAERGGLVQRCVTVLNMLGARLQALDPSIARTPAFQVSSQHPKPCPGPALVFQVSSSILSARLPALDPPITRTPAFQASSARL